MRIDGKGLIDRSKPVRFTFNGKPVQGFQDDTVASALLANDIRLVGRSFKYHRPRGIYTAGSDEPNALITVGQGPEHRLGEAVLRERQRLAGQPFEIPVLAHMDHGLDPAFPAEPGVEGEITVWWDEIGVVIGRRRIDVALVYGRC